MLVASHEFVDNPGLRWQLSHTHYAALGDATQHHGLSAEALILLVIRHRAPCVGLMAGTQAEYVRAGGRPYVAAYPVWPC